MAILETARTRLETWQADDWLAFRPIASDPEVMRYISDGRPWPEEQIREFVTRQMNYNAARQYCLWKLVLKETGAPAGFCGIQPLIGTPDIEIGWWLARACWGQGLATEAAREALRDAFERVGLHRVVAVAQPANRASIHVMEKLGMSFERTLTHKGIPVVLYSISVPAVEGIREF
ncbi:MAG TPA: GNAT family N-acetyltransferase [Terriglobia bacterium]|nr:GNAT family N-acetyltransferase [Terriglobia bacterium]